jgi:type II secretory pathway pseudopilin PulG
MLSHSSSVTPLQRGSRPRSNRRAGAFTIVQVLVSMSVGSIVLAVCVPKVKKSELQSRATIIVSDIRTFASAFEGYAQEKGAWPAEADAGTMPTGMADRLGPTAWLRATPIGGQYNWESDQVHGGTRYRAVISISETSASPLPVNEEMLKEIDRLMDDGNLNTGHFRVGVSFDPIYIVQQ